MIVARKRPAVLPLRIAARKNDYLNKTIMLYRVKHIERTDTPKPPPPVIPFDQWIMPAQEEGYIKCRSFDFL